jgi:ABC-type branched-subunit amino acid transport system substrate-binding protein
MKKIYFPIIIVVIVLIGVLILSNKSVNNKTIKIGVATLLNGDYAALGENIVDTLKLRIDEINDNGGIRGKEIELVVEDSGLSGKDGLSAMSKLINVDKVKYIIAGMTSNGTLASADLINTSHTITMVPVTGGSNIDKAGQYIFRVGNSDVLAGRDIAKQIISMGYKRIGIVSEVTEYTQDIANSFLNTLNESHKDIVINERFEPNTKDFKTLVNKVVKANPQAIVVLSQTGTNAALFIKQLREMRLSVKIFTDFTLATNSSVKDILGSMNSIYFADPMYSNDSKMINFTSKYKDKYNRDPFIAFHSAATIDSVDLIISAISNVGDDSVLVQDWLSHKVVNYDGYMGRFSLDSLGNSDLGFRIKYIDNDKIVEINQ